MTNRTASEVRSGHIAAARRYGPVQLPAAIIISGIMAVVVILILYRGVWL